MIVDVVFERGLRFLVVANVGDRPAHAVRVTCEQPLSGVGGEKRMHRLALFRRLEFLAPRKSIEVFLDRSDAYFARGEPTEPTELTARVSRRTPEVARRAATTRRDLEIYRDLGFIEREVPQSGRPA